MCVGVSIEPHYLAVIGPGLLEQGAQVDLEAVVKRGVAPAIVGTGRQRDENQDCDEGFHPEEIGGRLVGPDPLVIGGIDVEPVLRATHPPWGGGVSDVTYQRDLERASRRAVPTREAGASEGSVSAIDSKCSNPLLDPRFRLGMTRMVSPSSVQLQ